jgi:hypothetical protein
MSHMICSKCGSNDHYHGYGFAAGGLGTYTLCLGCDEVLERTPDPDAGNTKQSEKENS